MANEKADTSKEIQDLLDLVTQLRDAAKESGAQGTSLDESRIAILEDHKLFVQEIAPSIELVRRATGMGDGSDVRQKLALDYTEEPQK